MNGGYDSQRKVERVLHQPRKLNLTELLFKLFVFHDFVVINRR